MTYRRFAARRRAELAAGSRIAETACGPVEYVDPGSGRPVLYFHGGPGGHDQVRLPARILGSGYRLIGWSRPGYLRTPLTVGRTFAEQADAAAALLGVIGVGPVVAYGISAGGPCALEFARRHPERTTALVLESAVSRRYAPRVPAAARLLFLSRRGTWLVDALLRGRPRTVVAGFVAEEAALPPRQRRDTVDRILADDSLMDLVRIIMASLTPYEDRAAGLANDLDRLAELDDSLTAGVRCPTLVLHGSHDGDVALSHAEHVAATVATATLHVVDHGWHLLPLSGNASDADRVRREFLAALP